MSIHGARSTAPSRRRGQGVAGLAAGREAPASRLSAALALRAAALCALGMAAIWVLAALVPVAHWRDAVVLNDFTELSRPSIDGPASTLLHLLDPLLYTVWALLIVAVALLRRRPRVALAVAIVLPTAPLAAELIKPLAAHPHAQIGYQWITAASWPSGHATAAMTLVLCALLVAPHRLRPTIAVLGSAFAVAVGFSLLILAWHMPSDILGGYLLAALFASLALAALRTAEARRPSGATHRAPDTRIGVPRARAARWRSEDLLAPATIVLAGALAFTAAALVRAGRVASFAGEHHLAVFAAAALAALVVLICSSLTLALRR